MELSKLIEARKKTFLGGDPLGKLLVDIQKLDSKRADNLFPLVDKVNQLRRRLTEPAHNVDTDNELRQWLHDYQTDLDAALVERRRQFGGELADKLVALGLKLKGQYPKLHAGLFTLTLDFDKGRCCLWYGPEQEELANTILDAGKVATTVHKLESKLGSGLEAPALVAKLRQAYRHVRLDNAEGPVPVPALLPYVALLIQTKRFHDDPRKGRYREYGRADFSYDLYRLREDIAPVFRLNVATRQQTLKRSNFLWVPAKADVESGNYFATVEIKEEKL